uniref:Cullin-5 n=2 Tax=Schistocephalus solidus TaxID=70667 RepID=A0A0X3P9L1_SCHSO
MLTLSENSSYNEKWPRVHNVVKRILNMESVTTTEWQNIFSDIYSIISWQESACDSMLASLTESIGEAIDKSHQRIMRNQDESALLRAYIHEWSRFFERSGYLPQPFSPLENFIVGKHHSAGPNKRKLQDSLVRKLMLDTWDLKIFKEIKQRLEDGAMKLIQDEREGTTIDSSLVIGVRESSVNLCTTSTTNVWDYVGNFETAYIESMEKFYRPRNAKFIADHGIRKYLSYAQQKLSEEEARARVYLDSGPKFNSIERLMQACVRVFVIEYQDEILSEFPKLLRENDMEKLRLVYELITHVPNEVNPMLEQLEEYIWYAGTNELQASAEILVKDAAKYVTCLQELLQNFSRIIEVAFHNDPNFLTARDKAYQRLVNDTTIFSMEIPTFVRANVRRPESRCPELLASYCDMLLRKSPTSRRLTSDEILKRLQNVLLILKYVNSKDVFMLGHKSHLMRRLILETSADNELEEQMVERLREVGMPAELVNSLARMFQDIKVSQDLTAEFKEKIRNNQLSSIAGSLDPANSFSAELVNIKILSSGTWLPRTQPKVSIALPPELEDFIPQVEEFYRQKHQGRNLVWQYHLSNGVVAYFVDSDNHVELEMTTLQIAVLFAWRHRMEQRLRLDSLLTATGLSDSELRRVLVTLTEHPKMDRQLILYAPKVASEKEYTNDTEFWINPAFGVNRPGRGLNRRRVNMIGRLQLTQIGCEEESLAIVQLRQLRVQEAIIKIIKTRKRLTYNEIYKEIILLLKDQFIPSKRLLKEVLEWLIEQHYLRREAKDMDTFVYIS